jgi:flavin-dependent dehydrogenase
VTWAREHIDAHIVIDAAGARSEVGDWLESHGVQVEVDSRGSGFVYACRHYRSNDPSASPPRA